MRAAIGAVLVAMVVTLAGCVNMPGPETLSSTVKQEARAFGFEPDMQAAALQIQVKRLVAQGWNPQSVVTVALAAGIDPAVVVEAATKVSPGSAVLIAAVAASLVPEASAEIAGAIAIQAPREVATILAAVIQIAPQQSENILQAVAIAIKQPVADIQLYVVAAMGDKGVQQSVELARVVPLPSSYVQQVLAAGPFMEPQMMPAVVPPPPGVGGGGFSGQGLNRVAIDEYRRAMSLARAPRIVKVFYATDRNITGNSAPSDFYGSDRGVISYGTCEVSIPRSHEIGELETPSISKLEFDSDEKKHIVLRRVAPKAEAVFFAELASDIEATREKSAFIFVHGYRTTFADSARRAAQMAADLKFPGTPVIYSWPSKGAFWGYTADEATVELAALNLKTFLEDFLSRSGARNVYLIAHSMGNRALTQALIDMYKGGSSLMPRIQEIVLGAPDIDADLFKRKIAPALTQASKKSPVTLYASSKDWALLWSKVIHAYPRAGDSKNGIFVGSGIETIDASNVDSSLDGHSYLFDDCSVIGDLSDLISNHKRVTERPWLIPVHTSSGRYWQFTKKEDYAKWSSDCGKRPGQQ